MDSRNRQTRAFRNANGGRSLVNNSLEQTKTKTMKTKEPLTIGQKEAVAAMLAHIVSECSRVDTDSRYDDMLDECFSFESVGGIFSCMSPSRVLKEVDPVAYRCGKNDWLDGERDSLIEIEGNYYNDDEVQKSRGEFIDGLSDELSELQDEAADLDATDDEVELEAISDKITRKEMDISACQDHAF